MPQRVAVIGAGYWGRNLVRNFAALGALAAVADANPGVAGVQAAEHGVEALSVEQILDDPSIEAVAIAVPAAQHFEVATRALAAGKHIFVEKPISLHTADAEALCVQADEVGRTLMVGHLLHYHPAFLALRQLVDEGGLGRVQYVYSNRLNLGRIRREEDILWSFAPHDISMILSLLRSEPEAVWAVGARYLHKSIADVTTTHLAFPGGERAHVFVSWLHPFKEQRLVIVGDRGMAVFDDSEPWTSKLVVYRHHIDWHEGLPDAVKAEAEPLPVEPQEPLKLECQHFLDCVATGDTPRTDGWEGLRVLRVLDRAARSMAGADQPPPAELGPVSTPPPLALVPPTALVPSPSAAPATRPVPAGWPGVEVHESAYVDDGVEIGTGTKIWHFSHVMSGSRIGQDCSVGQNVVIGPAVTIGDGCRIQNNVSVYEGVSLADGVFCGPSCVFTNVLNPRAEVSRKDEFRATPVGRGASIGANATIVCGSSIGDWSLIGAGAVVTADVPDHALMVGVPARRVGWVSHEGEILGPDLVCPRSQRRYRETADGRLEEAT